MHAKPSFYVPGKKQLSSLRAAGFARDFFLVCISEDQPVKLNEYHVRIDATGERGLGTSRKHGLMALCLVSGSTDVSNPGTPIVGWAAIRHRHLACEV